MVPVGMGDQYIDPSGFSSGQPVRTCFPDQVEGGHGTVDQNQHISYCEEGAVLLFLKCRTASEKCEQDDHFLSGGTFFSTLKVIIIRV